MPIPPKGNPMKHLLLALLAATTAAHAQDYTFKDHPFE